MNEVFGITGKEQAGVNEKIRIDISHRKLWEEFHRKNNEMILTNKGRCIYPRIGYSVKGMEPKAMYAICLKLCRADRARYKYTAGEWHAAGSADPEGETKVIYSDNGLMQSGQYWMNNGIRFGKLKITNSAKDCSSNILLTSMHKYRPVLSIYKVFATPALRLDGSTIITNQYELVKSYSDQVMDFIAVTAYQNQQIIEMKKMHNSYARGQRGGSIRSNNELVNDVSDAAAASTMDHSSHLPISPLNRYHPYWTNPPSYLSNKRPVPHQIHVPLPSSYPPANCPIQAPSPNSSSSSHTSSTHHRNSSGNSNSPFRSPSNTGNNSHTAVQNLEKQAAAVMPTCGISNSPSFPGFNFTPMWNYGNLFHHFPVPYPSFIPPNSSFLGSNI